MLPKVNQILYIQIASVDEEEARQEYKSRIAAVSDDAILIEVPIHEKTGKLKRLYVGDQLSTYFVSDGGVKNYFNSDVMGFDEDVVRLVSIRKPDPANITKVQRRGFLRVPAELELACKLSEHIQFLSLTEDVGGGGVSFQCDGHFPLSQKDALSCWLLVPYRNGQIDHVPFVGEVVRVKTLESGRQLVMLRFAEIADAEQQKIIRFCFERQLDFRKK